MVQAACLLTSTGELIDITTEYEGLKKGINDIVATEWNWHGSQLLLLDRAASIVGERVLQPAKPRGWGNPIAHDVVSVP